MAATAGGLSSPRGADRDAGPGTDRDAGPDTDRNAGPDTGLPDLASAVLDVVDLIPSGRVMTYGDVAEYLGHCGPRQVGYVMARWGGAVAWWRVLRADGSPPPGHESRALEQYHREATPLRPDGRRVDLRRARWDGVPP